MWHNHKLCSSKPIGVETAQIIQCSGNFLQACIGSSCCMVFRSIQWFCTRFLQVSHHIHCNDLELDEDVFSAFPFLRFDARMPRKWFHKYQHMYMVRACIACAAASLAHIKSKL